MQWYATGSVRRSAAAPETRCAVLIHRGRDQGSFRKIQAAEKIWNTPSTAAALASQTFMWIVSLKKSRR